MTQDFIETIHHAIATLSRYAEPIKAGTLTWDGKAYAPSHDKKFDPYAAKWLATLNVLAEMIRRQGMALSEQQKSYLDSLLFGGMGSFNDFAFDERYLGEEAEQANQELIRFRRAMFDEFQHL